jgi:cytochrome c2
LFVEDPAKYDAFVANLRAQARAGVTDPRRPERGKQLMQQKYPCGSCHTLPDAGLTGIVGPNLTGVATRAANDQDGRLTKSGSKTAADYLRQSILNPSAYIVPSFQDVMPKNFSNPNVMPDDDREAIVNYLLTQK